MSCFGSTELYNSKTPSKHLLKGVFAYCKEEVFAVKGSVSFICSRGLLNNIWEGLENLSGNPSASLGIGQRMVVVFEVKTAAFGHRVELMIG